MKKFLLILLSILMLVSILTFVSCNNDDDDEEDDSNDKNENEASSSIESEESSSIEEIKKPDTVEITFDSNGGSPIDSQIIEKGSNIEKPADPIKEGYELEGWYIDGEKWSFYGYTTTKDITLTANWVLKNYNVTFEGATHTPITFTMEDEVKLDVGTPATESEFFYWCSDKELTTPIFKIPKGTKSDITIYAKTMTKEEINNNPEILIAGSATGNTDVKIAIVNFGTSNILAFRGCTSLETVIIKHGTTIHDGAFLGCTSLKNVIILSDSVETIGKNAFSGCTSLENITIPSSVTTMGENVFYDCSSLTTINCEVESLPSGWNENWKNNSTATVNWNCGKEN